MFTRPLNKRLVLIVASLFISLLLLAGCAGSPPDADSPATPDRKDRLEQDSPKTEIDKAIDPVSSDAGSPAEPDQSPTIAEVPPVLLEAILADLIERTGAERESIEILHGKFVIWNDGSLGCPKPGEFYTQAMIEGYQVILRVGESEYDYHASERGSFFICENSDFLPFSRPSDPGDNNAPEK